MSLAQSFSGSLGYLINEDAREGDRIFINTSSSVPPGEGGERGRRAQGQDGEGKGGGKNRKKKVEKKRMRK